MFWYQLIIAGVMLLPSVAVSQPDSTLDKNEAKMVEEIAEALSGLEGKCTTGDEVCRDVTPPDLVSTCKGEGSIGGGICAEVQGRPGHCVCYPATPPPNGQIQEDG